MPLWPKIIGGGWGEVVGGMCVYMYGYNPDYRFFAQSEERGKE
jgi:hypothetical protein